MYNILLYTLKVAIYIFNLYCFKICIYFLFVFPLPYAESDDTFQYNKQCYYRTIPIDIYYIIN